MNALETESSPDWEEICPVIDEALANLSRADRDAILLRYFEQRSHAEIGTVLGSNEEAARKRVARALEKLRGLFARRGISTTATVLSTVLSAHAVQVAPAGLAATLTSASLTGAAGAGATLTFMTLTKLKIGLISAMTIAGIATPLVIQHQTQVKLRQENQSLRQQVDQLTRLTAANEELSKLAAPGNGSLAKDQLSELLKLRGEVGMLRLKNQQLEKPGAEKGRPDGGTTLAQTQAAAMKAEAEAKEATITINAMKTLGLALRMYSSDNDDRFATNIAQLKSYIGGNLPGGLSLDLFEFAPNSQFVTDTMPEMIVFREKNPRQKLDGKWERVYTLADGSVQKRQSEDGNFEAYEKEHSMTEEMVKNAAAKR
jgi:hypothetical protein